MLTIAGGIILALLMLFLLCLMFSGGVARFFGWGIVLAIIIACFS